MRALLMIVVVVLAACRGNRITDDGGSAPGAGGGSGAPPSVTSSRAPSPRANEPETISLTAADLAPVDAFLHARNAQWIVGDEVEIVASREYFSTALHLDAPWTGYVSKKTEQVGDEDITTLAFRGAPSQAGVTTSPRAMIGTGLTVMARKTLRLRMQKTHDAVAPVRLSVAAHGDASQGVKDRVLKRGPMLVLGGTLRRRAGGYAWEPIQPPR